MMNLGKLSESFSQEISSICNLIEITRKDHIKYYFTNLDSDLMYKGNHYISSPTIAISAISNKVNEGRNIEISGSLCSGLISEKEITLGLLDGAKIVIKQMDFFHPERGDITIFSGYFGEIKIISGEFFVEISSISKRMDQNIGDVFSPICRARFASRECGVDVNSYIYKGTIKSINDPRYEFSLGLEKPSGYFNLAIITFLSGKNKGIKGDIRNYHNDIANLAFALPYDVEIGDEYEIQISCDKSFSACINSFNNAINFRGEPHIPGMDQILRGPGL